MGTKAASLALLALCEVAAMALWFSASAVVPSIAAEFTLTPTQASLFTSAVQAGFVAGTLTSAVLGLADRLDARRFFMVSTLVAAAANAAILLVSPTSSVVLALRFVTGACMAGVYPVGMKMAITWAKGDMGFLVAILVGALTLGSAAPHLFNAFGGIDWRFTIAVASVGALGAALLVNLIRLGPRLTGSPPFEPGNLLRAFSSSSLRLANFGYPGAAHRPQILHRQLPRRRRRTKGAQQACRPWPPRRDNGRASPAYGVAGVARSRHRSGEWAGRGGRHARARASLR